jgi:hypothetical protein
MMRRNNQNSFVDDELLEKAFHFFIGREDNIEVVYRSLEWN